MIDPDLTDMALIDMALIDMAFIDMAAWVLHSIRPLLGRIS